MLSNFSICSEAATGGVLWKWVFLRISRDSQESTCAGVSGAGVFPVGFALGRGGEGGGGGWALHLFYRSPLGDCFCLFICSFFNLKSVIRVTLQIYKLRKNILLNIICIKIMKKNYIYIYI